MPPRPTLQCCRALRQPPSLSSDHLWITDGHLASAFDRYCAVSEQTRRKVSHVPGPLESRRRLEKRNITDMNVLQPSPFAPWALDIPIDMSKWKWKAPTSAEEREKAQKKPGLLDELFKNWDVEATDDGPQAAEVVKQQEEVFAVDPSSIQADVNAFSARVGSMDWELIAADFHALCDRLSHEIYLGLIDQNQLPRLVARISDGLVLPFQQEPFRARPHLMALYSTVVKAIASSKVLTANMLDPSLWNDLLARFSKLAVDDELCELFSLTMATVPREHVKLLETGLLAVLNSFFSTWTMTRKSSLSGLIEAANNQSSHLSAYLTALENGQKPRIKGYLEEANHAYSNTRRAIQMLEDAMSPSAQRRQHALHARVIAGALKDLTSDHDRDLLDLVIPALRAQSAISVDLWRHMSYNWLTVLAHMPHVRQGYLFDQAVSIFGATPEIGALSNIQVCSLMLLHWQSRQYLKQPDRVTNLYRRSCSSTDAKALASLAYALSQTQKRTGRGGVTANLYSLCQFLNKLKRTGALVSSFEHFVRDGHPTDIKLWEKTAIAMNNPHLAIQLHEAYRSQSLWRHQDMAWDPAVAEKYARAMIAKPHLRRVLWTLLDIEMHDACRRLDRRPHWRPLASDPYGEKRLAVVERLATVFAHAEKLPNRVAFRHVDQCVRYIQFHRGRNGVPRPVVDALLHVVTQDMREGHQPGRTARLRWFLGVVHWGCGADVAIRAGVALREWRRRLKLLLLAREAGTES